MGKIDMETKEYVKRPEVFADLFNHLLYDGKLVIVPEKLVEMDTTELSMPYGDSSTVFPSQRYRDNLKNTVVMEDEDAAYALILGAENQTDIHYAMPVKNMVYDGMNYASQVSVISRRHKKDKASATSAEYLSGMHKKDKLIPVVTLVVYFGQKPWDGPMSIHEMLATQKTQLLRFIPDYRINLISPVSMNTEEIGKFQSDFKELAAFIQCGRDKKAMQKLVEKNASFQHMDPLTANIINDVTHAGLKLKENEKGEIDMCLAISGMKEDARNEGIQKGIQEGETLILTLIQKLFAEGRSEEIQKIAEDEVYRNRLLKEYGLEKDSCAGQK